MKSDRIKSDGSVLGFIGAYIPPKLKQALQSWAEEEGKTFSELIEPILLAASVKESCPTCGHAFK